jgi:hypothetical protein
MSVSSSSSLSRWALAVRQQRIIAGHENEPIQFSPLLSALKSRRHPEQRLLCSGTSDIVISYHIPSHHIIDSIFERDPIVELIADCQSSDIELSGSNISKWKFFAMSGQ